MGVCGEGGTQRHGSQLLAGKIPALLVLLDELFHERNILLLLRQHYNTPRAVILGFCRNGRKVQLYQDCPGNVTAALKADAISWEEADFSQVK